MDLCVGCFLVGFSHEIVEVDVFRSAVGLVLDSLSESISKRMHWELLSGCNSSVV